MTSSHYQTLGSGTEKGAMIGKRSLLTWLDKENLGGGRDVIDSQTEHLRKRCACVKYKRWGNTVLKNPALVEWCVYFTVTLMWTGESTSGLQMTASENSGSDSSSAYSSAYYLDHKKNLHLRNHFVRNVRSLVIQLFFCWCQNKFEI